MFINQAFLHFLFRIPEYHRQNNGIYIVMIMVNMEFWFPIMKCFILKEKIRIQQKQRNPSVSSKFQGLFFVVETQILIHL